MPFFPTKRNSRIIIILGLFFIVSMLAGCASKKAEEAINTEQMQTQQAASENSAVPKENGQGLSQEVRQIGAVHVEQKDQTIEIKIQGNKKLSNALALHKLILFRCYDKF